MLSGPRLLLSALALGMCVLGLLWWIRQFYLSLVCLCRLVCVGRFLVSFVLPLGFSFVVSLGIFMPVGSAGIGGHRWWIRGYPEAALPLSMLW